MSIKRKLTPNEQSNRFLALETLYGQKAAAAKLGISTDSFRRYRDGKRKPPETVYQKVNRTYNRNKTKVQPEKVQARAVNVQRRQYGAKQGRVKDRFAPVYPDYIQMLSEQFELDEKSINYLERLAERGYVAAWQGGDYLPVEPQFVVYGEDTTRFGDRPILVALLKPFGSPKAKSKRGSDDEKLFQIREFRLSYRTARDVIRLRKSDKYLDRIRKLSEFAEENLAQQIDKRMTIETILGFYFDEDDEV